ncbi:DUF2750 domain-containing protein [Pseudoalteromonas sp. B193]
MFETVQQFKQVWILNDDDGCVMLANEDDDCVPVWPTREFAEAWATGEWAAAALKQFHLLIGLAAGHQSLEEDDLLIAAFPTEEDDGTILFSDEFEKQLRAPKKNIKVQSLNTQSY